MMYANGKLVALAFVVLLFMPGMEVAAQSNGAYPSSGQMTIWRARRMFNVVTGYRTTRNPLTIDRSSFRVTPDSIEFDAINRKNSGRQHFSINLRTLEPVSVNCKDHHGLFYCDLLNEAGKRLDPDLPLSHVFYSGPWGEICFRVKDKNYSDCFAPKTYDGELFVSAVNRLRAFAKDSTSPLRNPAEQAAAWRALATKPQLPEQVRLQRLLAEDAIKSKRPAMALYHYESGLEIDPTWPQGYFNAALIAAELGFYASAVEHMQSYLELVPDAPDAQSARDQIAIWQYKAK